MPTNESALLENLQKAKDSIEFCLEDLREANKNANPIEHFLIIKAMEDVVKARNNISELYNAKSAMLQKQEQDQKKKIVFKPVR